MKNRIKKFFIAISALTILFFIANRSIFYSSGILEQCAATITYPFMLITSPISSSIHEWRANKESYSALQNRFDELKKDYLNLADQVITLRTQARTYNNIKELTEFAQRYNFVNALLAKIIVKNITSENHYIIVNRGARDGVKKNMVAMYHYNVVGRVNEVYDRWSKVVLITDQHCKVAAYAAQTQAEGIVQGFNNINRCVFTYVSHLFTIEDNDLVISSGQGGVFPEGFCLGRIVFHAIKEKALYHYVEVEPLVNFQTIHYCLIVDTTKIPFF